MSRRKLSARVRSVTPLHSGFLKINRYEFEVERYEGGSDVIVREVMERGDAVGVLGYDPVREEVVLVSEFRPGCFLNGDDAFTLNLVAGGVADGETACEAAIREMREEAGLELRNPVLAHPGAYVSSGGATEKVAIVVGVVDATHAGGVHGNAEESEDILVVAMSADDFIARVQRAEVTDMKTLVAGYWLAGNRERFKASRDA